MGAAAEASKTISFLPNLITKPHGWNQVKNEKDTLSASSFYHYHHLLEISSIYLILADWGLKIFSLFLLTVRDKNVSASSFPFFTRGTFGDCVFKQTLRRLRRYDAAHTNSARDREIRVKPVLCSIHIPLGKNKMQASIFPASRVVLPA